MIVHAYRMPPGSSTACPCSHGRKSAGSVWRLVWLAIMIFCSAADAARGKPARIDLFATLQPSVRTETARSRELLVCSFERRIQTQVHTPFADLAQTDQILTTSLLRNFGLKAYSKNWTKKQFRDFLLGLSERWPHARPILTAGWRIVSRWGMLEPSMPHQPMPEAWLHAILAVLAAWGMRRTMVCFWLAFYALLRPGELCTLMRTDLLLPGDYEGRDILIRIRSPKRKTGGAKKEYVCIEYCDIPFFLPQLHMLAAD